MFNETTSLGLTGNFFSDLFINMNCQPEYPLFDNCIDASEYVPSGGVIDMDGSIVVTAITR
jgi:hypothetical protein